MFILCVLIFCFCMTLFALPCDFSLIYCIAASHTATWVDTIFVLACTDNVHLDDVKQLAFNYKEQGFFLTYLKRKVLRRRLFSIFEYYGLSLPPAHGIVKYPSYAYFRI